MYKIIGADQKEYGPITSDQIRQWLAEGRVNANTQALAIGTSEWKPLAAFAEFAAVLGLTSSMPPLMSGTNIAGGVPANAAASVKGPAIALIIASSLGLFFCLLGLIRRQAAMEKYSNMPQFSDPQMQKILQMISGPVGFASSILQLIVTILILISAIRMLALKNYTLVFVACILAVIPCITPCCGILTLPFGIWALVVLNKPTVKASFN